MAVLRAGEQYGRYLILQDQLAEGLCGPVYHALMTHDNGSQYEVALKILTNKTPQVRQYFMNEERLLKKGNHPHLVQFVHSNLRDEPYTLATAFADTFNHRDELAPLKSPTVMLRIIEHIASALDYLHYQHPNAPVVHRDVKPDNILVDRNSRQAILVDLSVASHADFALVDERGFGSPPYMAPEQYVGHEVPATDQYALALVGYYFLYGKPMTEIKPPKSKNIQGMHSTDPAVYHAALEEWNAQARPLFAKQQQMIQLNLGQLFPRTSQVLIKAINFDPAERHSSCTALAIALAQALNEDGATVTDPVRLPNNRRKTLISLAVIMLIMLLAIGSLAYLWKSEPTPVALKPTTTTTTQTTMPTMTLPPAPTAVGALPSSPPQVAGVPTITLPPPSGVSAPTNGQKVRIIRANEVLRAAPGENSANALGTKVLTENEEFQILDAQSQKVAGDQRAWYKVKRLTDGVEGWLVEGSFQ